MTDFPPVVTELISNYNITVEKVFNAPEYKAILFNETEAKKMPEDPRFLPGKVSCGEIILELKENLLNTTNIHNVADDAVNRYHVKVIDVFDMPTYKAIAMLAELNNPILNDPRFVNYNEPSMQSAGYLGAGELDTASGHIASAMGFNETVPDSIKRSFSMSDLIKAKSNATAGKERY